ncbi:hypothetical protein [Actinocorallia populi]|uniref:hypothetical protein n=1 Tax=Actinocorallia populi TaxID=2079200 RepID=UPI000D08F074|nr:hypothetical protein [Actinocorallia populi]
MSTTTGPGRKPVRRVRVIEILDDEELDEATIDAVLAAADAEEAEEAEEAAEPKAAEPGEPGESAESGESAEDEKTGEAEGDGKKGTPAVVLRKADSADTDAADTGDEAAAGDAGGPGGDGEPEKRTVSKEKAAGGRTTVLLTAGVVVLALLAGFALFQWRAAASAAAEREEIVARVTAFGDVMATYSFDDIESANEKAMTYLTGDALEEREKVDLKALREQLESQKTELKSSTYAVYVGSVDGSLASAVLVFDLRGESAALAAPQTIAKSHLTLGLIKRDGKWMISSMVPAGSESASSAGTSVTPVPSGGPTPAREDGEKDEGN